MTDEPIAYAIYGRVTGNLKWVEVLDDVERDERAEFYDVYPLFRRTEEPEWEYGVRASGDDDPYTDHSEDRDWVLDHALLTVDDELVRRRKAGPWAPVEQEGEPS